MELSTTREDTSCETTRHFTEPEVSSPNSQKVYRMPQFWCCCNNGEVAVNANSCMCAYHNMLTHDGPGRHVLHPGFRALLPDAHVSWMLSAFVTRSGGPGWACVLVPGWRWRFRVSRFKSYYSSQMFITCQVEYRDMTRWRLTAGVQWRVRLSALVCSPLLCWRLPNHSPGTQ
jgi:hypothetical protein